MFLESNYQTRQTQFVELIVTCYFKMWMCVATNKFFLLLYCNRVWRYPLIDFLKDHLMVECHIKTLKFFREKKPFVLKCLHDSIAIWEKSCQLGIEWRRKNKRFQFFCWNWRSLFFFQLTTQFSHLADSVLIHCVYSVWLKVEQNKIFWSDCRVKCRSDICHVFTKWSYYSRQKGS